MREPSFVELGDRRPETPYSHGDVVPMSGDEESIPEQMPDESAHEKSREFAVRHIQMMALSEVL
jgi:hypothetical protein